MVLKRWLILSIRRSCQRRRRHISSLQLRLPEFFLTLEFAETGGKFFASYDAYLTVACSLLDFVMGVMSAFSPSRRNRGNRGWLWTPAAPIFTSVFLSLSRSPRPHALLKWRSSLARRSTACSLTWQTLSTGSSSQQRSEGFSPCPWWRSASSGSPPWRGSCRRHDAHFPAVQSCADGVDARACFLPDHFLSVCPCRRASVTCVGG